MILKIKRTSENLMHDFLSWTLNIKWKRFLEFLSSKSKDQQNGEKKSYISEVVVKGSFQSSSLL